MQLQIQAANPTPSASCPFPFAVKTSCTYLLETSAQQPLKKCTRTGLLIKLQDVSSRTRRQGNQVNLRSGKTLIWQVV